MQINMSVDDSYINFLAQQLGIAPTEVVVEALRVLNWVVKERARGQLILSTDQSGGHTRELETPNMKNIRQSSGTA